jgi:hypothetical protein
MASKKKLGRLFVCEVYRQSSRIEGGHAYLSHTEEEKNTWIVKLLLISYTNHKQLQYTDGSPTVTKIYITTRTGRKRMGRLISYEGGSSGWAGLKDAFNKPR